MVERRAFPRWPVTLDCEARVSGETFSAVISQISENGLDFVSRCASDVGEELALTWSLESCEAPLQVHGVVRTRNGAHTGVEFLNLTLRSRMNLLKFILECEREVSAH